jgi:hypothetical protein
MGEERFHSRMMEIISLRNPSKRHPMGGDAGFPTKKSQPPILLLFRLALRAGLQGTGWIDRIDKTRPYIVVWSGPKLVTPND